MTRPDAIVVRRFRVFGLWILRRCQKIGFLWTKFAEVGNFAAIFGSLLRNHYVAQCLYLGFLEIALFTMAASRCESLQKTPISAIFVHETAKIWHRGRNSFRARAQVRRLCQPALPGSRRAFSRAVNRAFSQVVQLMLRKGYQHINAARIREIRV